MDLQLSISGKRNVTQQIYQQLRQRILDGRVRSGERLPSTRELAGELSVARKTVTNIYDLLISEGFLESRRGSGTFVSGGISEKKRTPRGTKSPIVVNKYWNQLPRLLAVQPKGLRFDFGLGVPDTSRFAFSLWRGHIRKMRRVYEERRHVLLNCLQSELSEWLKVWPSFAGLHIAAASRRAFSPEEVTQSASVLVSASRV